MPAVIEFPHNGGVGRANNRGGKFDQNHSERVYKIRFTEVGDGNLRSAIVMIPDANLNRNTFGDVDNSASDHSFISCAKKGAKSGLIALGQGVKSGLGDSALIVAKRGLKGDKIILHLKTAVELGISPASRGLEFGRVVRVGTSWSEHGGVMARDKGNFNIRLVSVVKLGAAER